MDHAFCPGSKLMRQPRPDNFECPTCGEEVEIWSDEIRGACLKCGTTVMRDGTMSCLDWCSMGRDCVGEEIYGSYIKNKAITVKQRLFSFLEENYPENDSTKDLSRKINQFAETLSEQEKVDGHVVLAARILASVESDINVAEIRKLFMQLGYMLDDVETICAILLSLKTGDIHDSDQYRVVHDAVLLSQDQKPAESQMLTASGTQMAKQL